MKLNNLKKPYLTQSRKGAKKNNRLRKSFFVDQTARLGGQRRR
jgi:hypothetical protein